MENKTYNFAKKNVQKNKVFPGYSVIKLILTCRTWLLIKEIPKVIGFLGIKEVPHILNSRDVKNVYNVLKKNYYIKKHEKYKVGSYVKIIDGPFANFCGVIKNINMGRKKARVQLSILGRETSIELQFTSFDEIK
jgi:transcriptional antiterminator NusG